MPDLAAPRLEALRAPENPALALTPSATVDPAVRLRQLFDAHYDFVWRSVRRLGVPEAGADDAAQEVFVVASRRLGDIAYGSERAFLFGTALRVASDVRRAAGRRRETIHDVDAEACALPDAEELTDRKRAREMLDRAIDEMPDELRAVFVLFELEGTSMAEIATWLRIPQGTVASRLRRARETFDAHVARLKARGGRS